MTKKTSCDVVVVGAGLGGLCATLELALNGTKVILLEQHNLPGGFATSFKRGRFEFEVSLHEMSDVGPPSDKGNVRKFLERAGVDLELVAVPEAYRLILTEDGLDVCMPFGLENFIDAIEREAPGSKKPLSNYFGLCRQVCDGLDYITKSKGNPDKKVLRKEHKNFLKTLPFSVEEVTGRFDIPDRAKDILYPYWCYLGVPMGRLSFTLWAAMLMRYLELGAFLPKNRSHELACALDARIRELGGQLRYNTKVEKILVENGEVKGVEVTGEIIATKHVIANASPTLVYNELVHPQSEVPKIARKYINARIHGLSAFVVYLGLDTTLDKLGLREYSYFISTDMDTDKIYRSTTSLGPVNMQATICLNNAIPDCSPPGTSIMSLTTLYKAQAWQVEPQDYFKVKKRIANAMIEQFEKATGTKIREHIEEIEVATPQTMARYTGAYNGIVYGYEPEPWDSAIPRGMAIKEETYISGIQFAGGNAYRCHGFSSSMLSGSSAALFTLQEMEDER